METKTCRPVCRQCHNEMTPVWADGDSTRWVCDRCKRSELAALDTDEFNEAGWYWHTTSAWDSGDFIDDAGGR